MSAAPARDQKTVIVSAVFGLLLVIFLGYAYTTFFGGSSAPAPAAVPVAERESSSAVSDGSTRVANSSNAPRSAGMGVGAAPGVAAKKMASTSSSLDPTLHESAMLRTENLVYAGTGRNIFSATYTPAVLPTNVPKARPGPVMPVVPVGPPPPPPPPPINLKFFGTAVRANGGLQAFLLNGEDVYLASVGEIVARKYKIVSIGANSIQIEDLQNDNSQSLQLQTN